MKLNKEVTAFVDGLKHPLQKEINQLRQDILESNDALSENIKWNGPNYCFEGDDRITMRIQPPKQIQLVFHRGAKVKEQPKNKLILDVSGLLTWKTNDRAVATFKNMEDIISSKTTLARIINEWLGAAII
jgi:hypothetical protein